MSDKQQRSNHSSAAGPRPPISTKNPITGEELPEGYIAGFEPNSFFYNDDKGIRHSIYMPKGTHKPAIKYYEEQNWDELAKYPKWENQKYTAEDVIFTKIEDDEADEADRGVVQKEGN